MLSILDVKKKLPKDFIEDIYNNYTPLTVDKILSGMLGDRKTTVRVNTLKSNVQDVIREFKENNIKFDRVEWYKDALVIKNVKEKELQNLEIYQKGKIYLQSLSSMIPPLVLNPKPNEKVLDLTAAPGSKTTEISALMENKGYILANELDSIRCERLRYNIEMQGANIVEVINKRGEKVGEEHKEEFDKVLLDAPCSGEGRFLGNSPKTYRTWSKKTVNELAKLQKKLLKSAYEALKPGGVLVYSTCTLNKKENEEVLEWALENLELKLLDINLDLREKLQGFNKGLNKEISKAIRILPSKNMEGFFIAKFKKI